MVKGAIVYRKTTFFLIIRGAGRFSCGVKSFGYSLFFIENKKAREKYIVIASVA